MAHEAHRSDVHRCPGCGSAVLLKRGARVVAHFAHARGAGCAWAQGETRVHLSAKASIAAALRERGLDAQLEFELASSGGDRRADILVRDPRTGRRFAIEIQHSALALDAISRRTHAYAAADVPVIWIATLDWSRQRWRSFGGGMRLIERFAAAPWQRYAAAYHGQLWFWADGALWRGRLDETWVANAAVELGWSHSARWVSLTLEGPFAPASVRIAPKASRVEPHTDFQMPAGFAANLIAPGWPQTGSAPPAPATAPATTTVWRTLDGRYAPRIVAAPVASPHSLVLQAQHARRAA